MPATSSSSDDDCQESHSYVLRSGNDCQKTHSYIPFPYRPPNDCQKNAYIPPRGCRLPEAFSMDSEEPIHFAPYEGVHVKINESVAILIGDSLVEGIRRTYLHRDMNMSVLQAHPGREVEFQMRLLERHVKSYSKAQLFLLLVPYGDPIISTFATSPQEVFERICALKARFQEDISFVIAPGLINATTTQDDLDAMRAFLQTFCICQSTCNITVRVNSLNVPNGYPLEVMRIYRQSVNEFPRRNILVPYINWILPQEDKELSKFRSDLQRIDCCIMTKEYGCSSDSDSD